MNSIDRALAILLLLTGGKLVSATELSRRFEVSLRTIYRDIDRLLALGVPVEAARGAEGGYRLASGYIQPPVSLTRNETASLLVALTLVRGLKATPLSKDLEQAEKKLLASLPKQARDLLIEGARIVGIERMPADVFHPERQMAAAGDMQSAVDRFMEALLAGKRVRFRHENPYRERVREFEVEPYGILFDRDRWYVVGREVDEDEVRIFRTDRIIEIEVAGLNFRPPRDFDIRAFLDRSWLSSAMRRWEKESEITRIEVSAEQAETLTADWYYRHAAFTPAGEGRVLVSLPETRPEAVLPIVRWLGPGARLVAPEGMRKRLARELANMAAEHRDAR
ncbi:WYL domain-containing protein [Stappia sp. GBMRC 2046]|uniref:WYL domain-containing protein n=1 Tax=Stappia sediminis TaxID=2692190 RepID=A0A7X3LX42_9HYPH|nr:YafY family protein [Stappia sediminis]MXN66702.1 WYL domain-containing protein [Stappia sediminis]